MATTTGTLLLTDDITKLADGLEPTDPHERTISTRTLVSWPVYFPAECPPQDAAPSADAVFRLVQKDQPQPDDFLPWCIENERMDKKKPCMSCGISVFDELADLRRMQRRVPSQRMKFVARGILHPELGVSKPTGKPTHRSWWMPEGADPSPTFKVVASPLGGCSDG